MGDRKQRSKKRSTSKNQPPLKGFTLYLCNCVDYDEVVEALEKSGIRYKRHRDYFPGYAPDTELLKLVGQKGWILITGDRRQRIKPLEKQAIKQFRVREFLIGGAGNIGDRIVRAVVKSEIFAEATAVHSLRQSSDPATSCCGHWMTPKPNAPDGFQFRTLPGTRTRCTRIW